MYQSVINKAFCPDCMEADEKKFQEVKSYVWEHKGCSIIDVVNECGVEERQVKEWMRENRLQFATTSGSFLECLQCGEPILSGKYCEKCLGKMNQNMSELKGQVQAGIDARNQASQASLQGAARGRLSYHTEIGRQ